MSNFFQHIMQRLVQGKIDSPRLETRLILAEVLGCNPEEIYENTSLTEEQKKQVNFMVERRLQHCPLDKIFGRREFYKFAFITNENVLSPRPDTEILVESALLYLSDSAANILDLGTGSGCIILSLLAECKSARGVAVDISAAALQVARQNAQNLGLSERVQFINAGWFEDDFLQYFPDKFAIIVSNPPYIPSAEIAALDDEVKNYDPRCALDGGDDGCDSYRKIAELAPSLLKPDGYILLEVGKGQACQVADIFTAQGLHLVKIIDDLSGVQRCVILQKTVA